MITAENQNLFEPVKKKDGTGNALSNFILGDAGVNVLSGLDGNDTLEGWEGHDIKTGGAGADVFKFTEFGHADAGFFDGEQITDFTVGEDKIDISELLLSKGAASFNASIGGLETRGFTFIGDALPTGVAGQVSIVQTSDLVLVIVEDGAEDGPDLSFLMRSSGEVTRDDFILSPRNTDVTKEMLTDGSLLDFSDDETTTWDIGSDFTFATGVGYGFGDVFRVRAGFDQPDNDPNDEFDGRLGGSSGNGVLTDISYTEGQGPAGPGSIIQVGATFSFGTSPFVSPEQGDPTQGLILDIDRNLDGVKDFELELLGDYRGAQFRSELVNGDIHISLYEGNSDPTGTLTIDGDLDVFQEVTVNTDNLFDRDGIDLNTVEFQWFNNGEAIQGETDAEYRLRLSDIGDFISVEVTYTDMFGTQETVMSQIAGPVPATDRDATGSVSISGTARQGEELTANILDIRDPDGPDPRTAEYQWLRNGVDIAGATSFGYVLMQEDVGQAISVRFTFEDLGGNSSTFTSTPTAPVENINDPAGGIVTIDGNAEFGNTISANIDAITDPDGVTGIAQNARYQWFREGAPIDGATNQQYFILSDVFTTLSVRVDFEDDSGASETITSAAKLTVSPGQIINGTPNPETISNRDGSDVILAGASDDVITRNFGNDTIDGGPGIDRANFNGDQSSYTVVIGQSGVTVDHRETAPRSDSGTNFLTNVELLDFGTEVDAFQGQPVDMTNFGNVADLTEAEFTEFIELYIAYFNRAPDAIGLFFWGSQLAKGFSLEDIATLFFDQEETRATYPDLSDVEAFAKEVYANVLGRAFDQAGLDFWVGVLSSGDVSLSTFMLEIIKGAKAPPQPGDSPELTAQKLVDVAYLTNKTDLGAYFSVIKGMSNVDNARDALQFYDGSQASIDGSKGIIDAFFEEALDEDTGEFLFQLTGVVDDPFAIV